MTIRTLLIVPDEYQGRTFGHDIAERLTTKNIDPEHEKVFTACQKLVEGYVEILPLTPYEPTPENEGAAFAQGWHLSAYVNEDGIGLGMYPNVMIVDGPLLFGPVVIVHERVDGDGNTHYRDVTDDDWNRISRHVQLLVPKYPTAEVSR